MVSSNTGLRPLLQRDKIARGITRVHHEQTGAPEPFVRVDFQPVPFGNNYTAGEIAPAIIVFGNVRAGRAETVRQNIVVGLHDVIQKATDAAPDQIVVGLNEVPSKWLLEAGFLMPEATE